MQNKEMMRDTRKETIQMKKQVNKLFLNQKDGPTSKNIKIYNAYEGAFS